MMRRLLTSVIAVDRSVAAAPTEKAVGILNFKFSAVCTAVLTGLLTSDVLSALPNPTLPLTMPVGEFITGVVRVLFVSVCTLVKVTKPASEKV